MEGGRGVGREEWTRGGEHEGSGMSSWGKSKRERKGKERGILIEGDVIGLGRNLALGKFPAKYLSSN